MEYDSEKYDILFEFVCPRCGDIKSYETMISLLSQHDKGTLYCWFCAEDGYDDCRLKLSKYKILEKGGESHDEQVVETQGTEQEKQATNS